LVAVGTVWIAATISGRDLPGTLAAGKAERDAVTAYTHSNFADAIGISTHGLRSVPMDWRLYYDRAVGEALVDPPQTDEARADFLRARFLQPIASELPYNEGLVWINEADPSLVFQAWQEAMRRAPGNERESLYSAMLRSIGGESDFRDILRKLAGDNPCLILDYLDAVNPDDSLVELDRLRGVEPALASLNAAQKRKFFKLWARHGDRAKVVAEIAANGQWLQVAWPLVVGQLSAAGDYKQAYQVCHKFAALPIVPQPLEGDAPQTTLQAEYYSNPADFLAALSVYDIYRKAGAWDKARIVLDKVTARNGCPPYFFLLKAELLASEARWQEAVKTLELSGIVTQDAE
jgi:tetratricopeptide (TPR) repeat protein